MTPPYEQHGANFAFWTIFGAFVLGEYAMRVRNRLRRSGTRTEWWSLVVVVVCVGAGMTAGFRLAHRHGTTFGDDRWPVFVAGLVLMLAGLVVRQWAIHALGSFFTVDVRVHANQTVVDRGPYRFVRHPSYTALILFFVGVGLSLTSWASLAVLAVVPTVGLIVRIHVEERALLAALGEDYRRFAATRRRLFPGVW